jgi:Cu(I)/Ag(I) efflux system membrane fusion protein
LQKVDDDEMAGPANASGESQGQQAAANDEMDGRSGFSLTHEKQQLIGVTTAKVEVRMLSFDVRASGRVAFDPDLYTAIEEYRQAAISDSNLSKSRYGGLREQSSELIKSAKTKLRLMGLTNSQIEALVKKSDSMDLILPQGSVWVYAEVFEYEIAGIKAGQTVEVSTPSFPGKSFSGKITSLNPTLNAQTRTVRVRAQVPDPDGVLRPDTFVNVRIKVDVGKKLAVPENSVMHSGEQDFVFVAKGQGRFEPRVVGVGYKTREYYEILNGLTEGETVVTAANFLIDSESRLRAAIQHMATGQPDEHASGSEQPKEQGSQANHAGHGR